MKEQLQVEDELCLDEEIPYSILENYLLDIEGLSPSKKMFIIMLRRYAGSGKSVAFPSYNKLQRSTGNKSPATIMKCIDFFIWLRWIERKKRKKGNGDNLSNVYIISLKNIRLILEHFNKNEYSFLEIEKYFENMYKDNKNREEFLNTTCKFLLNKEAK